MKLVKSRRIAAFVALAATWSLTPPVFSQQQPPAMPKADAGSFITKELMVLKGEGGQFQMAMWFPFEFFVKAGLAEAGTSRAEVERRLRFLKPYHTIVVQCGLTQYDGSTAYASQRDVCARGVRSRQCQGFPRNPGRFHPGSGLSPSLDQLGAIEREASFL